MNIIVEKENVDKLPGKLFSIEQHSDCVVTEFSFNFIEEDGTYTRYFTIKEGKTKTSKRIHYMGKDSTTANPEYNNFFNPIEELNKEQHPKKYESTLRYIESNTKMIASKNSKMEIWDRKYPKGAYDIVVVKKKDVEIVVYVINDGTRKIIKIMKNMKESGQ